MDRLAQLDSTPKVTVEQAAQNCCRAVCCACLPAEKWFSVKKGNELLMSVDEESGCCLRCFCLWTRAFHLNIVGGKDKKDILYELKRPCICCPSCSCSSCCRPHFEVFRKSDGARIGDVSEDFQLCCTCYPSFSVKDAENNDVYKVEKDLNCCQRLCCQCCPIKTAYTIEGGGKGKILRLPKLRAVYTDADTYEIQFPPEAKGEERILLLAASILVDYALDAPEDAAMD